MKSAPLAAALLAATSVAAAAAVLEVPSTYPTVGAALAAAAAGDSVRLAPGRYAERGLVVPGGVTVLAASPLPAESCLDGEGAEVPVLAIPAGAARVRILGLTFRNAFPALSVFPGSERHEIRECTFLANRSAVQGRGFAVHGSLLEGNPGVPITAEDAVVDACMFRDNDGGAVTGATLEIRGSTFEANRGTAVSGKALLVEDCTFRGNVTRKLGGGVAMMPGTVRRCRFEANESATGGGALYGEGGEIADCTFVGNRTLDETHGGAVYLTVPTVVTRSLFLRNEAGGDGGAIYAQDRTTVVDHSRFLGNRAMRGGAILVADAHLTVRYCTFLRNAATKGGAILAPTNRHRTLTVENSVIQETLSGGVVEFNPQALTPELRSCNLYGNDGGDWVGRIADQYPGHGNLSEDSRFCAEPEDSLFIATASPLIAANNRAGVDIGGSRAGCHSPGVLIASDPFGIAITVDGAVYGAPTVFPWVPGSVHAVAAPVQPGGGSGERFDFTGWSDGGAPSHTVVAPAGDAEFRAAYTRSFRVTTTADSGGSVEPATGWVPEGTALTLRAVAEPGAVFAGWTGTGENAYTGPLPTTTIDLGGPVAQHAHFYRPPPGGVFRLTMTGDEGGLIYPSSGTYAPDAAVTITAIPLSGFRFVKWVGEGQDSYSGEETRAAVRMHSDLAQHALFESDGSLHGAEFSLSASDTDPFVNTAPPTGGPRRVYLWLTCSQGGITVLECGVTSTVPLTAFQTGEGVYNFGEDGDLALGIDRCPTGERVDRVLGSWVATDTGGRICLVPTREVKLFQTWDCGGFPNHWPDPLVRGFSSEQSPPCVTGENGCSTGGAALSAPVLARPLATGLTAVAPNPFRGRTEVRFALERAGAAKVTLFDVAGRLVRVLREGELPAGQHTASWDGRTAPGQAAASGIYFVRFEAAGTRQTARVVYLGK